MRRIVQGSPKCETPVDFGPGVKASARPRVVQTADEPRAEPSDVPQGEIVFLDAELVSRARKSTSAVKVLSPPQCVVSRLKGVSSVAPDFPLCAMGLPSEHWKVLWEHMGSGVRDRSSSLRRGGLSGAASHACRSRGRCARCIVCFFARAPVNLAPCERSKVTRGGVVCDSVAGVRG